MAVSDTTKWQAQAGAEDIDGWIAAQSQKAEGKD